MKQNWFLDWIFEARTIFEFFKRLFIVVVGFSLLTVGVIGYFRLRY